jgi:hypothetical protein
LNWSWSWMAKYLCVHLLNSNVYELLSKPPRTTSAIPTPPEKATSPDSGSCIHRLW